MELFVGNSPGNGKTIRVAIIGIGGIGGYFGTRLVNCYQTGRSAEFAFIQRGKHLIEIQARGLKYRTRDHEYTVIPDITTDTRPGPVCSTWFFSVSRVTTWLQRRLRYKVISIGIPSSFRP